MAVTKNLVNIGDAQITGDLEANKISKRGGTSAQFLKADGSVDSNSYLSLVGGTMSNTNVVTNLNADLLDGKNGSDYGDMESITYDNLVAKRTNSQLIPGKQYRITDYTTTTTQSNTRSSDHVFDIIVVADSTNTLNENARAIQHSGDTYFANSNLKVWELKYCLDNDTNKFKWADSGSTGRGVIYYMKDEFNNECPYDFKNILYDLVMSFKYSQWGSNYTFYRDSSLDTIVGNTTYYGYVGESLPQAWNSPICYLTDSTPNKNSVMYSNTSGSVISYGGSIVSVNTSEKRDMYTFSSSGLPRTDITLSITNGVFSNEIRPYINSNKQCLNWIIFIGNNCYSNTFGDNCYSNIFGNQCYNNTFGDGCNSNTFGYSCYNNTFGVYCYSNTFGAYCYSNTFGVYCYSNTFGNICYSNIFGNYCNYNTFGNDCNYNTFGNGCNYITFGNSGSTKSYYRYIIVENGNQYIYLDCSGTTSSSSYYQNVKIRQGVNNTGTWKTITDGNVGQTYQTVYGTSKHEYIPITLCKINDDNGVVLLYLGILSELNIDLSDYTLTYVRYSRTHKAKVYDAEDDSEYWVDSLRWHKIKYPTDVMPQVWKTAYPNDIIVFEIKTPNSSDFTHCGYDYYLLEAKCLDNTGDSPIITGTTNIRNYVNMNYVNDDFGLPYRFTDGGRIPDDDIRFNRTAGRLMDHNKCGLCLMNGNGEIVSNISLLRSYNSPYSTGYSVAVKNS